MVSAVVAVWGRPNVASYALMTARNKTRVPEKGVDLFSLSKVTVGDRALA